MLSNPARAATMPPQQEIDEQHHLSYWSAPHLPYHKLSFKCYATLWGGGRYTSFHYILYVRRCTVRCYNFALRGDGEGQATRDTWTTYNTSNTVNEINLLNAFRCTQQWDCSVSSAPDMIELMSTLLATSYSTQPCWEEEEEEFIRLQIRNIQ